MYQLVLQTQRNWNFCDRRTVSTGTILLGTSQADKMRETENLLLSPFWIAGASKQTSIYEYHPLPVRVRTKRKTSTFFFIIHSSETNIFYIYHPQDDTKRKRHKRKRAHHGKRCDAPGRQSHLGREEPV